MKVLLTAINAKYIHSNLAIYSLKAYAKQYEEHIQLAEFTINNYMDDILMGIYKEKPDILAFSCYIWNIQMVLEAAAELKKVLPKTKIWLGGPEVSYDAKKCLEDHPYIDGIMIGEGEETFFELMKYYIDGLGDLANINGLTFYPSARIYKELEVLENGNVIVTTGVRNPMNMDLIPFVYEDMSLFENKIIYYETSRGCPYSCSYCLSSIEKRVRLRSTDLVTKELQFFLDHKVKQVKFVDRTFNCNKKHSLTIWNYLKEHDNGITNFHFEIAADILSDDEISLLNTLRPGLVQLEIGVQSSNPQTLKEIRRKMDMNLLANIVDRIHEGQNIHQHLDLIVGLPYEDLNSFKKSFNDVYALKPDQLQVGFLKVLKGSYMEEQSETHGIVFRNYAPYEVLYTNYITYDQVLLLKQITEMVEVYYNSGQFVFSIEFLEHFYPTPYDLYEALAQYYEEEKLSMLSHSRVNRYYILLDFFRTRISMKEEEIKAFSQILVYDLYLRENLKSRPEFALDQLEYKNQRRELYDRYFKGTKQRQMYHIECFTVDVVETAKTGQVIDNLQYVLFDYNNRSPLNHEALTEVLDS